MQNILGKISLKFSTDLVMYNHRDCYTYDLVTLQCCLSVGVRTTWMDWGRQYPGSQDWTTPFSPVSHRQASTAREKCLAGSMLTWRLTARAIMSVSRTLRTPAFSTRSVLSVRMGQCSSRRSSLANGGEYEGSGSSLSSSMPELSTILLK